MTETIQPPREPTHFEINQAVAALLGFRVEESWHCWLVYGPDEVHSRAVEYSLENAWLHIPNFCSLDLSYRDGMRLLTYLDENKSTEAYSWHLHKLLCGNSSYNKYFPSFFFEWWRIQKATPLEKAIAFLKACGKWPTDWQVPTN